MQKPLLRIFVIAVTIQVLSTTGYGQFTAGTSVTANGGLSELIIDTGGTPWTGSFLLETHLNSNMPVVGVQYTIRVTRDGEAYGGADSLFFSEFDPDDPNSYGSLFNPLPSEPPLNSNLFNPEDAWSVLIGGANLAGLYPDILFRLEGETGQNDLSVFPGGMLNYTITGAGVPLGNYLFTLGPDSYGDEAIAVNSLGDTILDIEGGFLLSIVPEPATLSLLALGVLMIRRRN